MQQSDPVDFLPPGIPSELRRLGRILHGPDEGLVAWDRSSAREVLACLRGTKVAVAVAEEKYYADHASYTTDLTALQQYFGCVIQPGVTITVHDAGPRGWAASGFHPGFPDRSCVQWVSAPDGVAVPETALEHRRGDSLPGGVVCDASVK